MQSKWISVDDRLPKVSKCVLVYDRCDQSIAIGHTLKPQYNGMTNWHLVPFFDVSYRTTAVSHWMPLPEKPKEEKVKLFDCNQERIHLKDKDTEWCYWLGTDRRIYHPDCLVDWLNSLPIKIDESANG